MKHAPFTLSSNYLRTQHLPCALAVKPYSLLGTLWILPRASPCWDEGWDCPPAPSSTPWRWLISREVVKQGTVFDCQCYRKRGDGQGPWLLCCGPKGKGFVEEVKVFLKGSVSFVVFSIREKCLFFFFTTHNTLFFTLYKIQKCKSKEYRPVVTGTLHNSKPCLARHSFFRLYFSEYMHYRKQRQQQKYPKRLEISLFLPPK